MSANNESVVIKKYANRRLYNTATSTYVTLENLAEMVKGGTEFNVYDAKSNEDITRSVLTQIIVEEEGKTGQNLLPIGFLRRLIGFYGDNMQWLVPKYLEHSLQSLSKNQEQIRDCFQSTFGGLFPFGNTLEQMSKQNLAMFERTMRMFSPFGSKEGDLSASDNVQSSYEETPSKALVPSSSSNAPRAQNSEKNEEQISSAPAASARTPKKSSANLASVPTPETNKATAQNSISGDEVQTKIAALQRQLSELAKNKA